MSAALVAVPSFALAVHQGIKSSSFPESWYAFEVWLQAGFLVGGWCAVVGIVLPATTLASTIDALFNRLIQDEITARWSESNTTDAVHVGFTRELVREAAAALHPAAGDVLSLGCGDCRTDANIWLGDGAPALRSYTGIDDSKTAHDRAMKVSIPQFEREGKNPRYIPEEIAAGLRSLGSSLFDVVVMVQTRPFFKPSLRESQCKIAALMRGVSTRLKPDGVFLVVDEFPQNWALDRAGHAVVAWIFGFRIFETPLDFFLARGEAAGLVDAAPGRVFQRAFSADGKHDAHATPLRLIALRRVTDPAL